MDIKKQLNIAGEGAKLVAKQAERMKVANVSLPGAYRKLGEEIFKAGVLQDKLGDQFTKIQSSIDEQEKLNQTEPAAEGFGQKMKAAAISAKNMAVSKKMEFDRGGMFSELGRLAFESHKEEIKNNLSLAPVEAELAKLVALDAEIAELGSSGQGSFFNPRNVAIGLVAVAGLAVAFIGYRFVFGKSQNSKNSNEEQIASNSKTSPVSSPKSDRKTKEDAAVVARHEPVFLQMLKDGDTAWDNDKKSDAVQHYSQLLSEFCGYGQGDRTRVAELHKPEMARVAGRAIDFLADSGNDETAKTLIKKANESRLVIIYSSPKSNRLVQAAKAEDKQEEKEFEEKMERESKQADGDQGGTVSAPNQIKEKSLSVPQNSTKKDLNTSKTMGFFPNIFKKDSSYIHGIYNNNDILVTRFTCEAEGKGKWKKTINKTGIIENSSKTFTESDVRWIKDVQVPSYYFQRISGIFFEEGDSFDDGKSISWKPIFKMPGNIGDKWSKNESPGFSTAYEVINTKDWHGIKACSVRETSKLMDKSVIRFKTYAKDVGLVEEEAFLFGKDLAKPAYTIKLIRN